jgi:hypothetical protein
MLPQTSRGGAGYVSPEPALSESKGCKSWVNQGKEKSSPKGPQKNKQSQNGNSTAFLKKNFDSCDQ